MNNTKPIYEDNNMKITAAPIISDIIQTNEEIAKLDMHQRIRILEYVTKMRDVKEIKDEKEARIVRWALSQKLITGHLPSELDPNKWNLSQTPNIADNSIKINEEIAKLDMHQRIRILEYVTKMRDVKEIKDEKEAMIVSQVLSQKLITGRLPSELDPNKWNLPPNPNRKK